MESRKAVNFATFQPYNLSTKRLVLRQHYFGKHGIPERRGITHWSEPEGKQEMFLYAQHCNTKLGEINLICKHSVGEW